MPAFEPPPASLPENVLRLRMGIRPWAGVRVEVAHFECRGRVLHSLRHEDELRLNALLDESGSGRCEPRLRRNQPCPNPHVHRQLNIAPAGTELWGYSEDVRHARDATLVFDRAALKGQGMATTAVRGPRLRFSDERVWTMVRWLSEAVEDPDPSSQLYGDGLALAISALLFALPGPTRPREAGLAPWQLRRTMDYLEARLPAPVAMASLAQETGLSVAHFSRAFKRSTGVPPYQWQLGARIRCAQEMLLDPTVSLASVAEATGFADAVHFGRTFRRLVGATPAAWRRDRLS